MLPGGASHSAATVGDKSESHAIVARFMERTIGRPAVIAAGLSLGRHNRISARYRCGSAAFWTASWSLEMNVS
jgi:hypothetical protein